MHYDPPSERTDYGRVAISVLAAALLVFYTFVALQTFI